MKLVFDGRTYGSSGFDGNDGETVCYSFYEYSLLMNDGRHDFRPHAHYSTRSSLERRAALKRFLIERDSLNCKYCKSTLTYDEATIDHYFPPWYWGDDTDGLDRTSNLVLACERCNRIKGKKLPWGFTIYPEPTNVIQRLRRWAILKKTHTVMIFNGKRTITGKRIPYGKGA